MKKWFYFLVPIVLLIAFVFYYLGFRKEAQMREHQRQVQLAREAKAEAARKAAIQERARQDAAKRAAERAAKAAKREQEHLAKLVAQGKEIQADTNKAKAEGDKYAQQISELKIELDNLHHEKANLNAKVLDLQKDVELAEIARRDAELEIQRMTAMVVDRAKELAKPPPVPVALKKNG